MKLALVMTVATVVVAAVAGQTNVLTKTVVKTYSGGDVCAETNVTRTVSKHEALKAMLKSRFKDIDSGLALRESRKGYRGGAWSPKWMTEARNWFDQQDLSKLLRTFEFEDSVGFRHLMSFAVGEHCSDSERRRVNAEIAELEAKAAISRAWDADAERVSVESKLEATNVVEKISLESFASVGTHSGIVKVHEKDAEIGGENCRVVVYGILPACMKFK